MRWRYNQHLLNHLSRKWWKVVIVCLTTYYININLCECLKHIFFSNHLPTNLIGKSVDRIHLSNAETVIASFYIAPSDVNSFVWINGTGGSFGILRWWNDVGLSRLSNLTSGLWGWAYFVFICFGLHINLSDFLTLFNNSIMCIQYFSVW